MNNVHTEYFRSIEIGDTKMLLWEYCPAKEYIVVVTANDNLPHDEG